MDQDKNWVTDFPEGEKHPYRQSDDVPRAVDSIVAFVDMLGYSQRTLGAFSEDDEESGRRFLRDLQQSLYAADEAFAYAGPCERVTFTDCVVIGWPVGNDAEVPLNMTCNSLAGFQESMSLFGFFMRGCVTRGDAYIDSRMQSGPALIKAHDGESKVAVYPRIIVDDSCLPEIIANVNYHDPSGCPQYIEYLVDTDGKIFINYLGILCDPYAFDDETGREHLIMHRNEIERAYREAERARNQRVLEKYRWAANYHDFFCESFGCRFGDCAITIDYGGHRLGKPKMLFEAFPEFERPDSE